MTTPADHDKRCPAAWDTSVKCNCGAQAADEIALIAKTLESVGITSLLNHGAASCVFTEGCAGVSQDHILAYTRKIALHCAVALAAPPTAQAEGWRLVPVDATEEMVTKSKLLAQPVAWMVYLPSIDTQNVYDSQDDPGYVDDVTNHADAEVTPLYEMAATKAEVAPAGEYPPLPEPLEIDWPELHSQALGCGVEDRGLRDRYECAEYGWQDGVDKAVECVPDELYDADQMRTYADATCAMRAQAAHAAVASPLTKLQRKAIAVCFTSDKVSVSEVQRKLSISYADAQTLCQSIVDLGLTDELELAPSLKRGAPASQPAPVAQGDAEDGARYRFLAEHCRSTSEHWGGRWSIVVEGPAPESHDSEDDFDAAIDAARSQAKEGGAA